MSAPALLAAALLYVTGLAPYMPSQAAALLPETKEKPALIATSASYSLVSSLGSPPPAVSAKAAIVIDYETGTVLYSKNEAEILPVASVVKLYTVLEALHVGLPKTLPLSPESIYPSDATVTGATDGEVFRTDDLLAATLISSANDAADTLGNAVSAKKHAGVNYWRLSARPQTFSGLTEPASGSASAHDISRLAGLLYNNPQVKELAKTKNLVISSGNKTYKLGATNKLLDNPSYIGLKTGFTETAGECLVAIKVISGHPVISVILGSGDRFGETETLLNFVEGNTLWRPSP